MGERSMRFDEKRENVLRTCREWVMWDDGQQIFPSFSWPKGKERLLLSSSSFQLSGHVSTFSFPFLMIVFRMEWRKRENMCIPQCLSVKVMLRERDGCVLHLSSSIFLSAFLSVKQEDRDQGRGKMRQKYVIFKRYGGKEGKNAVRDRFSESQEEKGEMTRWGWVVVGVLLLRQFLASCFSLWLTKAFRWRGEMRCKDDLVVSRFVYIILVGRWDERREMTWDMRMRDAMYAKWDDVGSELFWIEGEREWKSGSENGRQKRQVPSHLSSL